MNGIINFLKPPGMTSSNVVTDIRRLLQVKRVGHTGTLDPGAAGVLPICVGKATRLFDYLATKDKRYIAEIAFGVKTDTQDAYGTVLQQQGCKVTIEEVSVVMEGMLGERQQVPSLYSAIKVDGKKAYQLARAGQAVDLSGRARSISINHLELIEQTAQDRFLISINCSKGTYVRQFAEELGQKLGCLAYVAFLLRTDCGCFTLDKAYTLAEIEAMWNREDVRFLQPTDSALLGLDAVNLDAISLKKLLNGCPVPGKGEGLVRLYSGNEFIAVGQFVGGMLSIKTLFYDRQT